MRQVVFYKTAVGGEVVRNFIRAQSSPDRLVIGEDLMVVQKGFPIGLPFCDSLGDGLWEVRISLPSKREARLIFFHHSASDTLVVLHGFIKKTRKTPDAALRIAKKRKSELEKQE